MYVLRSQMLTHAKQVSQIAQKEFENRKTSKQVMNLWNRMWGMYKINRRREEHTGGKDGDEPSDDGASASESDDEDEDGVDGSQTGTGKKRKASKATTKRERFSRKQLITFRDSPLYDIIDQVYVISP